MPQPRTPYAKKRGQDACHGAFRQTLELLAVTDRALAELCADCPSLPDQDDLVLEGLNELALGKMCSGTRSPSHVLFVHGADTQFTGKLYVLGPTGYGSASDMFSFAVSEFSALSLDTQSLLVCNVDEYAEGAEAFQRLVHPGVREAIGSPIRNFIAYRIAGDRPGALLAFNYQENADRYEGQVLSALAITLGSLWTLSSRIGQVEEGFLCLVGALARASEVNDDVTGDHILRVSRHAEVLALAAGRPAREARAIGYSSQLHDVGKIHTPRELLRKPGPLTPAETRLMQEHALQGEKIIGNAPRLALARSIAGCHHENWDGSGYPRGLAGTAIPQEARIVRIVDVYEALRSERPYKPALSHEVACHILLRGDNRTVPHRHFDPKLLALFRSVHGEFQRTHAELQAWG